MLTILINAFAETLYMVLVASILAMIFGLPLGFLLYGSGTKQFFANKTLHYILRLPIAFLDSTPYLVVIICSVAIIKACIGSNTISSVAAILPLTVAAAASFSLATFVAIKELPMTLAETAKVLGATPLQAILKIYLPEISPKLVHATTKILIQLISYSTIAGLFGAGGLGGLMMQKGYYSFELGYIIACAMLLALTSYFIKCTGNLLVQYLVPVTTHK